MGDKNSKIYRKRNPLRGRNPARRAGRYPRRWRGRYPHFVRTGGKDTLIAAARAAAELVVEDALGAFTAGAGVTTVAGIAAVAEVAAVFAVAAEAGVTTAGVGGAAAFALARAEFTLMRCIAGFLAAFILAHINLITAYLAGTKALDKLGRYFWRDLDERMLEEQADITHRALRCPALIVKQTGDILGAQAQQLFQILFA